MTFTTTTSNGFTREIEHWRNNTPATATCSGANHRDHADYGRCDSCGRSVAKIKKEGRYPRLVDAGRDSRDNAKYVCWAKTHECDPEQRDEYQAAVERDLAAGAIRKGQHVVVARGRKVPKGTTGTIIWLGTDNWDNERVGIKDANGETHWTALKNVEVAI